MGNRNSGKSRTWNALFEKTVRTGKGARDLYLNKAQWIADVFLVSGSPQERGIPVEEMLPEDSPKVVLCSIQFRAGAESTFDYFFHQGYDVFVQWLNPGYSDDEEYDDDIGLSGWLIEKGAVLCRRDSAVHPRLGNFP